MVFGKAGVRVIFLENFVHFSKKCSLYARGNHEQNLETVYHVGGILRRRPKNWKLVQRSNFETFLKIVVVTYGVK